MALRAKSSVFLSCVDEVYSVLYRLGVVGGAGAAIQISEGSAAVGVKLFPCWYAIFDFVLGLFVLGSVYVPFTGACPVLS
jgi:hypothetical protein